MVCAKSCFVRRSVTSTSRPPRFGSQRSSRIANAVALVFAVRARGLPRLCGQGSAHFRHQLLGTFVKAHDGVRAVVGRFIEIEHIFHASDQFRAHLGNTPLLLLPRLEVVFLSIRRTVSWLIESVNPHSTAFPANSRSVLRTWPAGGALQATAIRCASCLPSILRAGPGRGLSLSARSKPSSTKRRRTRPIVAIPTSKAWTICSSLNSSFAVSRIRARLSRAGARFASANERLQPFFFRSAQVHDVFRCRHF